MKGLRKNCIKQLVGRSCLAAFALGNLSAGQQSMVVGAAHCISHQRGKLSMNLESKTCASRTSAGKVAHGQAPEDDSASYVFQTLPAPAGAVGSYAHGLSGTQIVGGYTDAASNSYGLLFSDGTQQVLSYPGVSQTNLEGINAEGTVVGDYGNSSSTAYGMIYKDGQFTSLSNGTSTFTVLTDINDAGAIVGVYVPKDQVEPVGILRENGRDTVIAVPGSQDTEPQGINESGEIVGTFAFSGFSYANGIYSTIEVPGSTDTNVGAISGTGLIAGSYYGSDSRYHGFVLNNGQFTRVDYPGAYFTQIFGIEDSGRIVGEYFQGADCTLSSQNCAFLATLK
jgi:hypothetical protein